MQAIEFQTTAENGVIEVPEKYRENLRGLLRVIVLVDKQEEPYDILTELRNNPIHDPNFKPLEREEIYER